MMSRRHSSPSPMMLVDTSSASSSSLAAAAPPSGLDKLYSTVPRPQNDKYIFAKMSTVYSFPINGFTKQDLETAKNSKRDQIEQMVAKQVKELVSEAKSVHGKWCDPDFGPTEADPLGALSLYGAEPPAPAGVNKYPDPSSLRWARPLYAEVRSSDVAKGDEAVSGTKEQAEEEDEEDEFGDTPFKDQNECWCTEGELFIQGSSSGDVIQGKLGDCWFLGALSVLATNEALLKKCFWRGDQFREYGIFVCVFYKDCSLVYVVIDDRLPVFASNGNLVFGRCKDPNELWVPIIEKAYAKLHGCYKSLIGGYVHNALADLTGFAPRLIGLRQGYMGFVDTLSDTEIWKTLEWYAESGSLMGCSIQAASGDKSQVESDAGDGLKMGHAYSLLGVGKITLRDGDVVQLVKCRNPWGFGEWTGPWGDNTDLRNDYDAEILKEFASDAEHSNETTEIRANDGTFFMSFKDWRQRFTNLFVAVQFPGDWTGNLVTGRWTGDVGGSRDISTWIGNPKYRLKFDDGSVGNKSRVFVGLYINDPRLILGKDYFKDDLYRTAVGLDIVTEEDIQKRSDSKEGAKNLTISGSGHVYDAAKVSIQPPYMYGSVQIETMLEAGKEYFIVPSLSKRKQAGTYYLFVYSTSSFHLEGGVKTTAEIATKALVVGSKKVPLSAVQFSEKKEEFREKLVAEAMKLNLGQKDILVMFPGGEEVPRTGIKRRLMDAGFNLADFPDEDFAVLDTDNNGSISASEFVQFFGDGFKFQDPNELPAPPGEQPDDLIFQPIDLEGELTVTVVTAKGVRMPMTWFGAGRADIVAKENTKSGTDIGAPATASNLAKPMNRLPISYEPATGKATVHTIVAAQKARLEKILRKDPLKGDDPKHVAEAASSPIRGGKLVVPTTPAQKTNQSPLSIDVKPTTDSETIDLRDESIRVAGLEAGKKLHTKKVLQDAEARRSEQLSKMKQRALNSAAKAGVADAAANSVLIKRKFKSKKLSILESPDVIKFLCYSEQRTKEIGGISVRQPSLTPPSASSFTPKTSKKGGNENMESQVDQPSSSGATEGTSSLTQNPSVDFLQNGCIEDGFSSNDPTLSANATLWDLIVDRVDVIASCRGEMAILFSSKGKSIRESVEANEEFFAAIEAKSKLNQTSDIPTPTVSDTQTMRRTGSVARSKTRKNLIAQASSAVDTPPKAGAASANTVSTPIGKNKDKGSKDLRLTIPGVSDHHQYVEVYRRMVSIPAIRFEDFRCRSSYLADNAGTGFVCGAGIYDWFNFFDKNRDGSVTFDEFVLSLRQLNIEFDQSDAQSLFWRFETNKKDGLVDWREFMTFFTGRIEHNSEFVMNPSDLSFSLQLFVENLCNAVQSNCSEIEKAKKYFSARGVNFPESKEAMKSPRMGDLDSLISYGFGAMFTSLDASEVVSNRSKFKSMDLGRVAITDDIVLRFQRLFHENAVQFAQFMKSHQKRLGDVIKELKACIIESFSRRVGNLNLASEPSNNPLIKLWISIAAHMDKLLAFDDLSQALLRAAQDLLKHESKELLENPKRLPEESVNTRYNAATNEFLGYNLTVLCRILADRMIYGMWNKSSSEVGNKSDSPDGNAHERLHLREFLSFSGFEAFIKEDRMLTIEKKLKYLVHLQSVDKTGAVTYFVHIYIPKNKSHRGAILVAYDPVCSAFFKIDFDIDTSGFPRSDELKQIYRDAFPTVDLRDFDVGLFNPTDTPHEDRVLSDIVRRLRLVESSKKVQMYLSEDPRLINELRDILEKTDLPFFSVVSDISVSFELSKAEVEKAGSLRKAVFSNIRKKKTLTNFLVSILPDILVILQVYDSHQREVLDWGEMLAHLTDNRNPFVTVELLPKYVEPAGVPFDGKSCIPVISQGDESQNNDDIFVPDDGPEEGRRNGISKDPCNPKIQKSIVDIDGGAHPEWNASFRLAFKPPKLTSCRVLFTDLIKLQLEDQQKYFVLMVREARDKSLFMTAYDPRSSTEYEVLGGPPHWKFSSINEERVFQDVYAMLEGELKEKERTQIADRARRQDFRLSKFASELEQYIIMTESKSLPGLKRITNGGQGGFAKDSDKIRIGNVVTPRLLVNVFNHRGSVDELLGSCQVSISSVLSGTGADKTQWSTLLYETISDAGYKSLSSAGSIMLKLGYVRNSIEKSSSTTAALQPSASKASLSAKTAPAEVSGALKTLQPLASASKPVPPSSESETSLVEYQASDAKVEASTSNGATADRQSTVVPKSNHPEGAPDASAAQPEAKEGSSSAGASPAVAEADDDSVQSDVAQGVNRIDEALLSDISPPATSNRTNTLKTSKDDEEIILRTRSSITSPSPAPPSADLSRTAPPGSVTRQLASTDENEVSTSSGVAAKSKTIHVTPSKSSGDIKQRPSTTGSSATSDISAVEAGDSGGGRVDWNRAPLPQHWEKRKDIQSGRIYYVDHVNKVTQWYHPDDPRAKKARRNHNKKT